MNKHYTIFLLLFSMLIPVIGQELNQTIFSDRTNSLILIGHCNRDAFTYPEFQVWFDETYESYSPKQSVIDEISKLDLEQVTISLVMATWCHDSRREVPGFYRILDEINFTDEAMTLINVNINKEVPGEDIAYLNIDFVPTFIIYMDGKEVGRIIESPEKSLEKDLLKILSH